MRFGIKTPVFLLELGSKLIGTETELLLKSRKVVPERLLASGFKFSYPVIEKSIAAIYKS